MEKRAGFAVPTFAFCVEFANCLHYIWKYYKIEWAVVRVALRNHESLTRSEGRSASNCNRITFMNICDTLLSGMTK